MYIYVDKIDWLNVHHQRRAYTLTKLSPLQKSVADVMVRVEFVLRNLSVKRKLTSCLACLIGVLQRVNILAWYK